MFNTCNTTKVSEEAFTYEFLFNLLGAFRIFKRQKTSTYCLPSDKKQKSKWNPIRCVLVGFSKDSLFRKIAFDFDPLSSCVGINFDCHRRCGKIHDLHVLPQDLVGPQCSLLLKPFSLISFLASPQLVLPHL